MFRKSQMRGIVVVGDTLEQAKDRYRAVATGEDVLLLETANGEQLATAASAGLQLLNPKDGEELITLGADEGAIKSLASASKEGVHANYVQCLMGCAQHIIADDAEMLKKCPACASDLPMMEEPNVQKQTQKGNGAAPKGEAIIAFASSLEEASQKYAALVRGDIESQCYNCDDVIVSTSSAMNFDIYRGVEAKATEFSPQIFKAVASAGNEVAAHHYVCVSSSCRTNVIASDESPLFCPECSAGLIDPADNIATASSDDEEEEDDEEDDYEDLEGDDEEEEEDDEEDEEDDEEEEEEDDEEEDEDEAITLSVSSAKRGGGVRRKATASASNKGKMVTVAASMVAYASSDMDAAKVDVAYAGNVAGEGTWVAFYDGIPFAKATASSSKSESFASDIFGRTFTAIAAEKGVATAMAELGFNEIKPEINIDRFVKNEVESQVEAQVAQIAQAASRDAAEFNDRFLAAIATASQGINRGFYKDMQNPIRVALASAIEAAGINGGEQLVAQAFAMHGDEYHRGLVAKASEILQYDLTVQNQIANAVSDMKEPETQVATASAVPVGRPVVNRDATVQKPREVATASAVDQSFMARLGGLKLGNRR